MAARPRTLCMTGHTAAPALPAQPPPACLGPAPAPVALGWWLGQGLAASPLPAPGARWEAKSLFSQFVLSGAQDAGQRGGLWGRVVRGVREAGAGHHRPGRTAAEPHRAPGVSWQGPETLGSKVNMHFLPVPRLPVRHYGYCISPVRRLRVRLKQRACVWARACVWPEGEGACVQVDTWVSVQSVCEWAPACEPVCVRGPRRASTGEQAQRRRGSEERSPTQ